MDNLFNKSDSIVREIYDGLLAEVEKFGPIKIEPKKTSIHVLNKSAFLGVHPRKKYLDLNIVTDQPIRSERVLKVEQVSKSRYHNEIRLVQISDVNDELLVWLKTAYDLKS